MTETTHGSAFAVPRDLLPPAIPSIVAEASVFRTFVVSADACRTPVFSVKSIVWKALRRSGHLERRLRNGSVMTRRTWIFAAFLLAAAVPAAAESVSTQMTVSARVVARAIVTVASQPPAVDVTAADVARGYVDVLSPIVVHGRTNSRSGYLLHVANTSIEFSSIQLAFEGATMSVSGEGWIARPYIQAGETLTATARLRLAPGVIPGRYPLPLSISGSPL